MALPSPRLSVVIPSRNRGDLLLRVLRALDRQDGVESAEYELIVVLDGDSQHTADMIRAESFRFELSVLEQTHCGVATARNLGWQRARADYVLFLDDDMISTPKLLAEHLRLHEERPDAVVLGRFSPNPADRRSAWTRYDEMVQEKRYRLYERGEQPSGVRCYSGNLAAPRALLERLGGFDPVLPRNEDVDFGYRVQAAGVPILFCSEAEALHCGYHDLAGWLRMPLIYGRLDVAIYRDRGYRGGLQTIVASFHDRHPVNRAMVRIALASPWCGRLLVTAATRFGIAAHWLGLSAIAFAAFSIACNILYWSGIRDGMRGSAAFWEMVRGTRKYELRPYERTA